MNRARVKQHTHRHRHEPSELPALAERLRRNSRRLTGPRRAILEILRCHPHPMSSGEIFAELPRGNGDLATVYRAMRLLETMGMVKCFGFGDGVDRFELLAEGDDGHHHHLVCTRCATVVEIDDCSTADMEEKIAARNGFKAVTHKLEFFGICPRCQ